MNNYIDFTQDSYRELLKIAKEKYEFCFYNEIFQKDRFILWRHDVDFSMEYALQLATIENEEGVKSTYFLHLHNTFYNLLDEFSFKILKNINDLGHQIGIHFDTHYYQVKNEKELETALIKEIFIFKEVLGVKPQVFSFHNTNEFVLSFKNDTYSNLINVYSNFFTNEVVYCSDSNGYWRFKSIKEVLQEGHKKLQILTHPGWWQKNPDSPFNRIMNIIDERKHKTIEHYENTLKFFNRVNIK